MTTKEADALIEDDEKINRWIHKTGQELDEAKFRFFNMIKVEVSAPKPASFTWDGHRYDVGNSRTAVIRVVNKTELMDLIVAIDAQMSVGWGVIFTSNRECSEVYLKIYNDYLE